MFAQNELQETLQEMSKVNQFSIDILGMDRVYFTSEACGLLSIEKVACYRI
jgi:hypothetical protein